MSSSLYYIWFLSMVLTNYGYVSNYVILASTNYSPSIYSAIWKQSVPISFWSEHRHNSAICKQSLVLSILSKLRNNSNQLFFYLLSKYHSYLKLVLKLVFSFICAIDYPTPSASVQFCRLIWHFLGRVEPAHLPANLQAMVPAGWLRWWPYQEYTCVLFYREIMPTRRCLMRS